MIDDAAKKALAVARQMVTPEDRQANLAAFMEGNHPLVPTVLFHGTNRNVQNFDPKAKPNYDAGANSADPDTGWFSKGFYLTPHRRAANYYADPANKGREGANVMPVHLSMKNPFILNVAKDDSGATSMDQALNKMCAPKRNNFTWRLPSEQTEFLKSKGYDGVIMTRDGVPHEYIAHNPNQIKSAIGNQGTYDPNHADITKASGGMIDDPAKAIRRAVLVAKGLSRAIGPMPGKDEGERVHPASLLPGVHVQAIEPQNFAGGGEVGDNPNFKKWFGNSVLHDDGTPRKYYTGTSKDKDFSAFNVGRHGSWFTTDPHEASMYATNNDSQGHVYEGGQYKSTNTASRVIPAYLKAENPYTGGLPVGVQSQNYKKSQSDWFDKLRAAGHDAWVPEELGGRLAVMLRHPTQIKSAVTNTGDYDPSKPRIDRASGGEVQPTDETGFDAFHGSPHSFDQFDLAHVGRGEGAQAYGHGAYLAGDEGIAKGYRNKLSGDPSQVVFPQGDSDEWGQPIRFHPDHLENRAEQAAARALLNTSNYNQGRDRLLYLKKNAERGDAAQAMKMIRRGDIKEATPGHIYHVRVNANPDHFLDWDKPLSEQHPHVKETIRSVLAPYLSLPEPVEGVHQNLHKMLSSVDTPDKSLSGPKGYDVVNALSRFNAGFGGRYWNEGGRPEASAALHAAGIPGIRYLDANSRGPTGDPTHNHVIFDPGIIDIKRRYKRGGGVGLPHKSDGGMLDDPKTGEGYATQTSAGSGQNGPEAGGLRGQGGLRGSQGVLPSSGEASGEAPLEGLPRRIKVPRTGATIIAGPDPRIRAIAANYAQSMGMRYNPPTHYAKVDEARGKRIAAAYEAMPHDPQHPLVKASYEALARETMAQYEAAKRAGFKAEFWHPDKQADPYADSPRYAVEDVRNNHHMYVFPTHAGYGSEPGVEGAHENPLLRDSGERWNGHRVTVNDIFRAVHDYYGHAKEGVGFRGDGEENAWRSHAAMFSPLARLALGTETRGQNSWLNYGPHGATNKTASTEDTVFAPPKIGILPHWVHHEGAEDFMLPEDIHAMAQAYQRHRSDGGQVIDAGLDAVRRHRDAGGFNGGDVSVGPQTVKDPVRNEFPGIYGNPRLIAQEAATRVAPESPALKRLFGVNREDLHEIGKGRVGNAEPDIAIKDKPRGSLAAENIMTPENAQRLQDVLVEAGKHKPLQIGMDAWYVHDPAYKRIEELVGPDEAPKYYSRLNNVYGMMSPGSAVTTEINRGAAANYLLHHNRTPDFIKYAGVEADARKSMPDFPEDIMRVPGHAFHSTSHAKPLSNYVEQGKLSMQSPKVPLYIQSSGVPETGFQTRWPVPDAHFTRAVGMADTRRAKKDFSASMSMPEYQQAGPWFSKHVAKPVGLEGVPAQARLWGAMSKHTGVDTAIGSPKLEMIANHIMEVAKHHKITPEVARDLVLLGHVYYRGGTVVDKALEVVRHHTPGRR